MAFTPTDINDADTPYNRTLAAVNVGRKLREIFQGTNITVLHPDKGDVFGVTDFESSAEQVGEELASKATELLREWGYDFPVVALPGAKGAEEIIWSRPDDYKVRIKLTTPVVPPGIQ